MQDMIKKSLLGYKKFIELPNQIIIINVLIVNLTFFLIHAWYLQNYSGVQVTERLSFSANDPTWMPPDQLSVPIIGVHHFGDFQIMAGYANSVNPYDPSLTLPAQYAPFTFLFVKFLLVFGLKNAYILYTSLTFLSIMIPVLLICKRSLAGLHWIYISLTVVLTQPFLTIFDRGNLQGLMSGLIFLSYYFYTSGRRKLAFSFLILAAALKGYPLLILLFMKRDRIKNFLLGLIAFTGIFVGSLTILSLGIIETISGYRDGLLISQGSCFTCGYSASSFIDKALLTLIPNFPRTDLIKVNLFLSLLILCIGIFIAHNDTDRIPLKSVFVVFAFLQLFPSLANNFTLIWAVIPLILICNPKINSEFRSGCSPKRFLIIISCIVSIMPNLVLVQGPSGHATWLMSLLSPCLLLVSYFYLLLDALKFKLNN